LRESNLSLATFSQCYMVKCTLASSRLAECSFSVCLLRECDLGQSNALRCRFLSCAAGDTDFSGAFFRYATFTDSILTQCLLEDADLSGANLDNLRVQKTDLTRSVLTGARVSNSLYRSLSRVSPRAMRYTLRSAPSASIAPEQLRLFP